MTILCVGLAWAAAGCRFIRYFAYVISPPQRGQKVEAEFSGLNGRTVAVMIVAQEGQLYEHTDLRLRLASAIAVELRKHFSNIKVVSSRRIVRYQDANLDWQAMDRPKLGKEFGADFVLQVTVLEYAVRKHGSASLYRGRIVTECALFDTSRPPSESLQWQNPEVSVAYPEEDRPVAPIGPDIREFQAETERRFATVLVRKFRDYRLKVEE